MSIWFSIYLVKLQNIWLIEKLYMHFFRPREIGLGIFLLEQIYRQVWAIVLGLFRTPAQNCRYTRDPPKEVHRPTQIFSSWVMCTRVGHVYAWWKNRSTHVVGPDISISHVRRGGGDHWPDSWSAAVLLPSRSFLHIHQSCATKKLWVSRGSHVINL